MTTGRVVVNAGTHRLLESLNKGPKSIRELRTLVRAVNGDGRFEREYMQRMYSNGYAYKRKDKWYITVKGVEMLRSLGPTKKTDPRVATSRTPDGFSAFVSPFDKPPVMRPGAMDFRCCPSRVNNTLIYPDGTVKRLEIENGN